MFYIQQILTFSFIDLLRERVGLNGSCRLCQCGLQGVLFLFGGRKDHEKFVRTNQNSMTGNTSCIYFL